MEVNKAILEGMVLEDTFNDILNEGLISNLIYSAENKKVMNEIVPKLKKIVGSISKTISKKYSIKSLDDLHWMYDKNSYNPNRAKRKSISGKLGEIFNVVEFDYVDDETGKKYEAAYSEFEKTLNSNNEFSKYAKVQDCSFMYDGDGAFCNIVYRIHEKYFKK